MSVHYHKPRKNWFAKWYEDGKEKRRYFKTEQEARAFEQERLAACNPDDERLTLGDLAIAYFRARPDLHPYTKARLVRFLATGIGAFMRDKYADALNRKDLEYMRQQFYDRKVCNNTINKFQAHIHAMLAWGVDQELISFNPWQGFKRLKVVRPVIQPSMDDFARLYRELPPWLQWLAKTAFCLALRPGPVELLGLTWNCFNWDRRIVTIRQGKSGRLKTVVPPDYYLAEARERYAKDMAAGIPWVIHRGNGQKVLSFRTAWENANKRAGTDIVPYDMRHLSATGMLAKGADLAAVSAQLGHTSVTTTGTFYAHVTPGSQARAAALLPALDSDTVVIQNDTEK